MKVLVLAAGRSTRVKPVEDKNFLRFAGKFLIEHQLDMLKRVGLDQIILVAGAHNIEQLKEVAAQYEAKVVEQEDLAAGMAGAVLSSESAILAGEAQPLLIMSSNDVVDQSALESIINAAKSSDSDAYMLAYEVDAYFPGGYLKVEDGRITSIIEKPGEGNEPSNLVNLVFHLYRDPQKLIETLQETGSEKDDRYEVALDALMKEWNFEAVPYSGYWQAIKYPWHIFELMDFAFNMMGEQRISPKAQIADSAVIRGNVVIEEGVKVFDHATIVGPAYIGKNSVVANNALIRESMLGESCVVGYSTEVARSFIGDDCWFHSNYVGDTIIGNNVSFGAGAICANLRLDEKEISLINPKNPSEKIGSGRNKLGPIFGSNIRVGVNTSLMPGVRIGSNTMITSGLTVAQDIDAEKFVSGKTELIIKDNRANLDPGARDKMKAKLS